jgi:apolipoprotein N-acyltransferase
VGNVFARYPNWVQWYSYTGVSGGTLWVLVLNTLLYKLFTAKALVKQIITKSTLYFLVLVILPALLSAFSTIHFYKELSKANVVVVQPNINAYTKVTNASFAEQLNTLISTSAKEIDSNTALLVWPETALYDAGKFNEENLKTDIRLAALFDFLGKYPKLNLFTGIESYAIVDEPTEQSRKFIDAEKYYEAYNGAVLLTKDGAKQFYHKSKLVPGVETLPKFLNILGKWFEDFGGTTNGYAIQQHRSPIIVDTTILLAPSICYESIYGEFMSKYIHNGANIMAIITNDGWWNNTPGHKQHFAYAKLRAIETRKQVVRSANTGISGIINSFGYATSTLGYNEQGALKMPIATFNKKTFYSQHPDILYKIFIVLALIIYGLYVWQFFKKRN